MHSITNTGTHAITNQVKTADHVPKQAQNAASFETVLMDNQAHDNTDATRGCVGQMNELDMDAFFAAWGSTDSHYDVDANGIVDGGDLTILLAGQTDQPAAGSVDDILQQWGRTGDSTADLNADGIVDGEDLVLALSNETVEEPPDSELPRSFESKLEDLLADWGSDATRSDLNGDGIVDGLDLSFLLGGRAEDGNTQGSTVAAEATPLPEFATALSGTGMDPVATFRMESARAATKDLGVRIFDQLQTMGFDKNPPSNIGSLVDAFKLGPTDSKALLSNLTDLFGGDGRKDVARG